MEVCCENCQRLEKDDDFDFCPVWQSCGRGTLFLPKEEANNQEDKPCD